MVSVHFGCLEANITVPRSRTENCEVSHFLAFWGQFSLWILNPDLELAIFFLILNFNFWTSMEVCTLMSVIVVIFIVVVVVIIIIIIILVFAHRHWHMMQWTRRRTTSFKSVTGDDRQVAFIFQRRSVLIQRFNSALFSETFALHDDPDLWSIPD